MTIQTDTAAAPRRWPGPGLFFGYCAIAVAALLIPWAIYELSNVVLLVVGAVLIATLLRVVAEPFHRFMPLPVWAALTLAGLLLLGVFGLTFYIFGAEMSFEFSDVTRRVAASIQELQTRLGGTEIGHYLTDRASGSGFSVTGLLEDVFSYGTTVIAGLIVIVISAIYLTSEPHLYRRGIALLFAERHRDRVDGVLVAVGKGLRLWLIGQLIEMAIIGLLSLFAVWLIGLPSIFALGLIAFVCEFIPFLGPILAAIPAVLVALTHGDHAAILTLVAYLLIHQIEGNLATPLIQRRLIEIPPALTLLGLAAVASLFGIGGILFAGPIVAILYVGVRKWYLGISVDDKSAHGAEAQPQSGALSAAPASSR